MPNNTESRSTTSGNRENQANTSTQQMDGSKNRRRNNLRKSPARDRPRGVRMTRIGMTRRIPAAVAANSRIPAAAEQARILSVPGYGQSSGSGKSGIRFRPRKRIRQEFVKFAGHVEQFMQATKTPAIDCGGFCMSASAGSFGLDFSPKHRKHVTKSVRKCGFCAEIRQKPFKK